MKAGMTFEKCRDHVSLIHAMAEAYPPHSISDASMEAYLLALHDVPLVHCAQAAVELIRRHEGEFIPSFGRWRSVAADFWNEAIDRAESSRQVVEFKPPTEKQRQALRREFHLEILRHAETDAFFAEVARSLASGKLLKKPRRSTGERLAEINADLDREHDERLASMTTEQLEARRQAVLRAHGPEKGGASTSAVLFTCDGCGKSLWPGSEAYRGPAPGKEGDSALCSTCRPRYSWATRPAKRRKKA